MYLDALLTHPPVTRVQVETIAARENVWQTIQKPEGVRVRDVVSVLEEKAHLYMSSVNVRIMDRHVMMVGQAVFDYIKNAGTVFFPPNVGNCTICGDILLGKNALPGVHCGLVCVPLKKLIAEYCPLCEHVGMGKVKTPCDEACLEKALDL